jgi:exodeoxyribonuclease V alpha subunit
MQIIGTIESVIFRNAENGYTVISLSTEGRLETAVGIFPPVSEGEEIIIEGKRVINGRFGEQIAAESVRTRPPTAPEGIIKYLSSDLFKGIGEITAGRILARFGEKTFEIFENEPIRLSDIQGISKAKAMELGEKFNELRNMQESIIFLQQYDISLNLAIKIFKRYKAATESIVSKNPYRLIYDIDGVGFFTADRIALKMGLDPVSPERVQASIAYVLESEAERAGHTYLPEEHIRYSVAKLLNMDEEQTLLIGAEIQSLEDINYVVIGSNEDGRTVMLRKYYDIEQNIARKLSEIACEASESYIDCSEEIKVFETVNGITLHKGQIAAIDAAVKSGGIIITGGPGTGKTTIIKCIISIFKMRGEGVALCAPTGRAAKRLTEATGEQAKTIHRLLDLDFTNGRGYFTYNENTRLPEKVIIIDEVSMADEYVFNALINAIDHGGRLIIVGDKDQLPSVGAGNVLADVMKSGIFPIMELTEIYRQGAESYIITNAHRINKGQMPNLDVKDGDFFFIEPKSLYDIGKEITSLCADRLPGYLGVAPSAIQVLCPMKKGLAGVNNINKELQRRLNPYEKSEMEVGETGYKEGDKIIHLNNNYQLKWIKENGESGEGVFNGDIGTIIGVDKSALKITVKFEDERIVTYGAGDFDQLALAYAITVHKSQGSEFDAVIVALTPGSNTILTRNLLYTAITRAKRLVVLIGDRKTVQNMVNNNYTARRYTYLKEFIRESMKNAGI